jgi:flavin reductase (DIM6/NTAB) family NADH-FMN oxidoreductase RutF
MGRKYLNPGALLAPIPPAIVSVGDMEKANVLTVAWTGILATVPPKTYISVRPSRYSYEILKQKREFVINLPHSEMARQVDFVGIYTGKKMDKFERCGLTPVESSQVSAPTVAECPIALECRVTDILPMGSHDVFIADIVNVSCKEELIDRDGKLRFDKADLLAYAHGEYYLLGERVGRFGFSTDKPGRVAKNTASSAKNTEKSIKNAKPEGGSKDADGAFDSRLSEKAEGKRGSSASSDKYGNKDRGRGFGRAENNAFGAKDSGGKDGRRKSNSERGRASFSSFGSKKDLDENIWDEIPVKKRPRLGARAEGEPFYKGMPKGKSHSDAEKKNKGAPRGKKSKGGKE